MTQTTARSGSLKAKIVERLNIAGNSSSNVIWRQLQQEMPGRHITWNYVQRICREWAASNALDAISRRTRG